MTEKEKARILRLINIAREILGKKPLKRIPKGDGFIDPVSAALGLTATIASVDVEPEQAVKLAKKWKTWVDKYEPKVVYLPDELQNFIPEYFAGLHPEFERKVK